MAQLSVALAIARTYLNDDNAIQFPDSVLIPKMQEAHRELQERLWVCGSPLVRNQSIQGYVANATTIPMPADMLTPTQLFENAAGSIVTTAGWTLMTETFFIPLGTAIGATLGYWSWQQEVFVVAGANVNRAVAMQYRRSITIPAVNTDPIGILFGESYLGARGAGLAAGSLASADALAALTAVAEKNLGNIIAANRGQQKPLLVP